MYVTTSSSRAPEGGRALVPCVSPPPSTPPPAVAGEPTTGSPLVALVEAARRGDEHAWNSLIERYTPLVRAICRRHRIQPARADDIVQNTWLKLFTHLDRIESPEAVGSWIAVTATRECLALHQRQRREVPSPEAALESPVTFDTDALIEHLDAARIRGALGRAVALLRPRERAVVAGLMDRDVSYAELASRLDMPLGAIGPVRGRALRKLRTWLTESGHDLRVTALGGGQALR